MGLFKLYTYNNVQSAADFLTNLRNVASYEGWVIDNFTTANPHYLYLHSNGNGNQSLYYSMCMRYIGNQTSYVSNAGDLWTIVVYGNTGYNSANTYDNQPGKWTQNENSWYPLKGYFITFPAEKQYIFINSSQIIVFTTSYHTFEYYDGSWSSYFKNTKTNLGLYIGSINLYKSDYSQGNVMLLDGFHRTNIGYLYVTSSLFGHREEAIYIFGGVLFENTLKAGSDLGLTVCLIWYLSNFYNIFSYIKNKRTYQYYLGGTFNSFSNKAIGMKPVVFVRHSVGGYTYFFPIGELPYWYTQAHPYHKTGDVITYGQRKFVIMSFFWEPSNHGVLLEVVE